MPAAKHLSLEVPRRELLGAGEGEPRQRHEHPGLEELGAGVGDELVADVDGLGELDFSWVDDFSVLLSRVQLVVPLLAVLVGGDLIDALLVFIVLLKLSLLRLFLP